MNAPQHTPDFAAAAAQYYAKRLAEHGPGPQGMDWKDAAGQNARFAALTAVITDPSATVLDYGCGDGALLTYLRARGHTGTYLGVDACADMVTIARRLHGADSRAGFGLAGSTPSACDYMLMSGVLHVRQDAPVAQWQAYTRALVAKAGDVARRGLAFNCLTTDVEWQAERLYYAKPEEWFRWCADRWGRRIVLDQAYGLYEFTLRITKID